MIRDLNIQQPSWYGSGCMPLQRVVSVAFSKAAHPQPEAEAVEDQARWDADSSCPFTHRKGKGSDNAPHVLVQQVGSFRLSFTKF